MNLKTNIFIFREILDKQNLYRYFRLRYQVYSHMKFIQDNEDQIDIDEWDLYSRFLAIFEKETHRLVGTLRFIYRDVKSQSHPEISEILDGLKDEKFKILEKNHEFPLMQAFDIGHFLNNLYFLQRNVVEIGRLSISPEYWKHNLASILAEFAFCHAYENGLDDCIIAVHPRHYRMYHTLGFQMLPDTDEVVYPGINNAAIAMHLDFSKVNEPHHSRALEMQQHVRKKGYFELAEDHRKAHGQHRLKPLLKKNTAERESFLSA